MYVVLDSNIYCGDYFAHSAPFSYLLHFLKNDGHILLIPRVVLEEVTNVRARKIAEDLETNRKVLASLRRMVQAPIEDVSDLASAEAYDLLDHFCARRKY